ncbi:hypothetical protein BGX38DRAFT_1275607 [Terfezia claveryi]|nr:hypothetical protein BGX38DRAFT_1275607 [Terfezia claveryi]
MTTGNGEGGSNSGSQVKAVSTSGQEVNKGPQSPSLSQKTVTVRKIILRVGGKKVPGKEVAESAFTLRGPRTGENGGTPAVIKPAAAANSPVSQAGPATPGRVSKRREVDWLSPDQSRPRGRALALVVHIKNIYTDLGGTTIATLSPSSEAFRLFLALLLTEISPSRALVHGSARAPTPT